MPAEWERHAATWLAWPHNRTDWPGKFTVIPWVYGEIARRLAPGETLRILVNSAEHARGARRVLSRVGAPLDRIEFLRWPTDRGWTRDFGPIFVRREGPRPEVAVARFRFTAWAKYPNWKRDDRIAERAAQHFKRQLFTIAHRGGGVVLEGGSIDVNGRGSLLTTEECLLDPVVQTRNPGMTRAEYEAVLREALGAGNILWLGKGIAGDDTHGHVDDLCRFVNPTTVVACTEHRFSDENYRALSENRERLAGMQTEDGTKLEVVELPMPEPLVFEGRRLPASYANFYVGNAAVLVPTFNDPADRQALGILGELFDRPVVGIHAVDLVWGLGTLHCLTQQEPEPGLD
jgi:agmatine deiminase